MIQERVNPNVRDDLISIEHVCRPLENRKFHLHRGQIYTSTRNGILYHSGELRSTLIVVCIDLTDYL